MLTGEEPISAPFELLLCKPRTPAAARRLWRIIHYVPDMTDAELEVRPYRDSDEPAVVALWERLFPDARAWNQPAAYIRRKLAVQRELFLVGALDGRAVATVLAGYDGVRGWVYHLAVAPEHRRHGYGRTMMAAAEARLRALGCPKINLQIMRTNAEVVRFYERLGYAVEDRVSMGRALG